jgi:hypothetical protein
VKYRNEKVRMMLEDVIRKGELLDMYGVLLTERQRNCLELYVLSDWSLAEIAAELKVSRQAVHDNLQRAVQSLEEYEGKLGLLKKREHDAEIAAQIKQLLDGHYDEAVKSASKLLDLFEY